MNRRAFLQNLIALPFLVAILPTKTADAETVAEHLDVWDTNIHTVDMMNTRRVLEALHTEYSNVIEQVTFEPNDNITRLTIRSHMENVLQHYQSRRVVYDYVVICDETNNPPSIIEAGLNRIEMAVQMKKDDTWYHLPIESSRSGANFGEIS
jgi:hypothetical protein